MLVEHYPASEKLVPNASAALAANVKKRKDGEMLVIKGKNLLLYSKRSSG